MSLDSAAKPVSFLSPRNESTQNLLGTLVVVAVGGTIAYFILPFVLAIAVLGLKLFVIGGLLVFGLFAVFNGQIRKAAGYLFQALIRKFWRTAIKKDAVGIMKFYYKEVEKSIAQFAARIGVVRGVISQIDAEIIEAKAERDGSLDVLRAAKDQNLPLSDALQTEAKKVERRDVRIAALEKNRIVFENLVGRLERYFSKSKAYKDDLADQIREAERTQKSVRAAGAAFKAAASILRGDSEGAQHYSDSLDFIREEAAGIVGDIEQFVFETKDAMEIESLRDAGAVSRVMDRLTERESKSPLLEYRPGQSAGIPMPKTAEAEPVSVDRFL